MPRHSLLQRFVTAERNQSQEEDRYSLGGTRGKLGTKSPPAQSLPCPPKAELCKAKAGQEGPTSCALL